MKEGDQCSLEGGAYGRVDAPFLWYKALRASLESLGFVACPFDGCLFSLITHDPKNPKGNPLLGGFWVFMLMMGLVLEMITLSRPSKGSGKSMTLGHTMNGNLNFCGVHYKQWDDGSIEMDQVGYVQKISPIEVPRSRRSDP